MPEHPKKPLYKRWWVIGIGFLVFLFILGGITSSSNSVPKTTSTPDQPSAAASCTPDWECSAWSACSPDGTRARSCTDKNNCGFPKPAETEQCQYLAGLNQPVSIDVMSYTVTAISTLPAVGSSFLSKTPDGIYLLVTLAIENKGKESKYLNSASFKVIDAENRKYETSADSFYLSTMGIETIIFDKLGPGLTTKGSILFDVPKNDTGLVLEISPGLIGKQYIGLGNIAG